MTNKPKYQIIYDDLLKRINQGEFSDGKLLPSELELTNLYSVSRITAIKALDLLANRNIIDRIAGKGSFLKIGNVETENIIKPKKTIGLIFCDIDTAFGLDILLSIQKQADLYGYHIILKRSFDNIDTESALIKALIDFGVSGIIIQSCHGFFNKDALRLSCDDFPIVFLDRYTELLPVSSVTSNNLKGAIMGVNHLIELGHKKIAFVSSYASSTSSLTGRLQGYKQGLLSNGIAAEESFVFTSLVSPVTRNLDDIENDIKLIEEFLISNPDITALFASELFVAQLLRQAILNQNKKIPRDYSIICFDLTQDYIATPYFTHLLQNQKQMGIHAFDILLSHINGEKQLQNIFLDTTLILGSSTTEPRK